MRDILYSIALSDPFLLFIPNFISAIEKNKWFWVQMRCGLLRLVCLWMPHILTCKQIFIQSKNKKKESRENNNKKYHGISFIGFTTLIYLLPLLVIMYWKQISLQIFWKSQRVISKFLKIHSYCFHILGGKCVFQST